MPYSATDSLDPAFRHTKLQLFQPFRLGQWTKLALVGLFAGEMGSGGSGNFNFNLPSSTGRAHNHFAAFPDPSPAAVGLLVVLFLIVIPVLWLLFLYISSRMRFVLFDSVVTKNCSIRQMWRARREPAFRYFVWQIVISLISLGSLVLIVGIPALMAFLAGWFSEPKEHIAGLILVGLALFLLLVVFSIVAMTVHVFTKDFVVPQMAMEDISAVEGWRRLLQMLKAEKGGYAIYALLKLGLALGAAFAVTMATFILLLVLLIPVGGLGIIGALWAKGAGMVLSWNVFTVTAAIVAGCVLLFLLFYGVALISVPVIVFFPAYSIYFFASRYRPLADVMYPVPPPSATPMAPSPEPA